MIGWKIWSAWCVSSVGTTCVSAVQVAVDELAQPARVVQRAGARAAADEELEARRAERVLDVDDNERDAEPVLGGGREPVLVAPALGLLEPRRVVDAPDLGRRGPDPSAGAAGADRPRK